MNKRLNITLPEQTVRLMDRGAGKGQRSSLIDRAVRRYVKEETRANLRKQLTESYHAQCCDRFAAGRRVVPAGRRGMATRKSIAHAVAKVYLAADGWREGTTEGSHRQFELGGTCKQSRSGSDLRKRLCAFTRLVHGVKRCRNV